MTRESVSEADLIETEAGLKPDRGDGWFVVNVGESIAMGMNEEQYAFNFEGPSRAFPHFGINVTVLGPGKPGSLYHAEAGQEAFLVLHGECVLVVEEEKRYLRQWDFVHCPPHTAHVIVGAGDAPCAVLMIGSRNAGSEILYPASAMADRYGAAVAEDTDDPKKAYAGWPPLEPGRYQWPLA
jgi:uncharacterized cupin superfamily protein